jgi:hypothetical protein
VLGSAIDWLFLAEGRDMRQKVVHTFTDNIKRMSIVEISETQHNII